MQVLTVVALLVAGASAQWNPYWRGYAAPYAGWAGYAAPYAGWAGYAAPHAAWNGYAAPYYAPAVQTSQFHAQDEIGQYNYGYAGGPSAKTEVRTFDGITRGSYSYVDANNKLQTVNYVADPVNGFRVAATNLPKADLEAPVHDAELPVAPVYTGVAPEPVQDTPDVMAARAEHMRLFAEAAAAAEAAPDTDGSERRKRDLTHITYAVPAIGEAKVKTTALEGVDAPVPASTRLLELKETEHTIRVPTVKHVKYELPKVQPLTYTAPLTYAAAPFRYAATPLTYAHHFGMPYSFLKPAEVMEE